MRPNSGSSTVGNVQNKLLKLNSLQSHVIPQLGLSGTAANNVKEPSAKSPNNAENERIVRYIEYVNGKIVRHALDFNSPRTKEAAAQIGATFSDCVIKYRKCKT